MALAMPAVIRKRRSLRGTGPVFLLGDLALLFGPAELADRLTQGALDLAAMRHLTDEFDAIARVKHAQICNLRFALGG